MWSCCGGESATKQSVLHVLNGDYSEADVGRMSLNGLEKLVAALIKCTSDAAAASGDKKPKWWSNTVAYYDNKRLLGHDERDIKLALKQLIVDCSQFFKERTASQDQGAKWCAGWSDEHHQKQVKKLTTTSSSPKRPYPVVLLEPPPASPDSPTKHQFLRYFRLNAKQLRQVDRRSKLPPPGAAAKLSICTHIPFSSDVGRLMAAREQHRLSEDVQLKRLERSEWYINREAPTRLSVEVEYELTPAYKEPPYCHRYKMPRRQFHQRRRGLHSSEFLLKFCTPLVVNLDRLDLSKVKDQLSKVKNKQLDLSKVKSHPGHASKVKRQNKVKNDKNLSEVEENHQQEQRKELVVRIDKSEKMCCDAKVAKIVRTSPRLRNL